MHECRMISWATSDGTRPSMVKPMALELRSWPNPFNPGTRLSFQLERPGLVNLDVYNLQGQRVASLLQSAALGAGTHGVAWEADSRLASGTYRCGWRWWIVPLARVRRSGWPTRKSCIKATG